MDGWWKYRIDRQLARFRQNRGIESANINVTLIRQAWSEQAGFSDLQTLQQGNQPKKHCKGNQAKKQNQCSVQFIHRGIKAWQIYKKGADEKAETGTIKGNTVEARDVEETLEWGTLTSGREHEKVLGFIYTGQHVEKFQNIKRTAINVRQWDSTSSASIAVWTLLSHHKLTFSGNVLTKKCNVSHYSVHVQHCCFLISNSSNNNEKKSKFWNGHCAG